MKINGYRDVKQKVRVEFNKTFLSVVGLSILSLLLLIVAFTPNAAAVDAAATDCSTCHSTYVNEIAPTYHGGVNQCIFCHTGYVSSPWTHSGTTVTETKCRGCHVEGTNLNESHGNHYYGQNKADCTQCHFANTTQVFELDPSLYKHSHNLTVEYNYYNYSLYGMPLSTNGGVGKGMFPYYTCTLTCHSTYKVEDEVIGWNQSAHANSRHGSSDGKNSCAKCKSPPNFDGNDSNTTAIAAADWQGIQCRVCHNLHNDTYSGNGTTPIYYAYYNSTLSAGGSPVYEKVSNATELCEKCHFPYRDDPANATHDSNYGGYHKETVGFDCANCHMNSTISNLTHKFEVKNTTSEVTGCDVCHNYINSHANFTQRSNHDDKVDCVACHDQTFTTNASGYAVYVFPANVNYSYGLWNVSDEWTTYAYYNKRNTSVPASWPLHNITRSVTCTKCHNATSVFNGTIAPALACSDCHTSYGSAVDSSKHNKTLYPSAPACTDCHAGYVPSYGHITGTKGYIVNESNTCRTCHIQNANLNESHGNHNYGQNYTDCTQCHFANTTQQFSLNSSLYTHDHNLTVEYNYYNYNLYGFPTESDHSASKKGMFPYYTCTLTCHNGTSGGQPKIENETIAWSQSGHAQVTSEADYYNMSCLRCHSPPMYNQSNSASIPVSAKQGIQCRVCHNLHNDTYSGNGTPINNLAFYNATLSSAAGSPVYSTVENATVLCEKCHRGGMHTTSRTIYYNGFHKTSLGFTCIDCHMNSTVNNGSEHSFAVNNTATGETGCEACHVATSEHTTSNFREYSSHVNVTCDACHDSSFIKNSSDYVVSATIVSGGIYKNTVTNKWTTYRGTTSATEWAFHNISKNVSCEKCHGARTVFSGAIAPNLTSGGTTYYTTDTLISGYNFILVLLYPEPTMYANYMINSSLSGVPGVNKTLNWNSTSQEWEGYENINGVYFGTNFTVAGYKAYFVKGSSLSVNKTYTLKGRK